MANSVCAFTAETEMLMQVARIQTHNLLIIIVQSITTWAGLPPSYYHFLLNYIFFEAGFALTHIINYMYKMYFHSIDERHLQNAQFLAIEQSWNIVSYYFKKQNFSKNNKLNNLLFR